jgi:NodT family efflux transporter outer membrane factor (OMF) lipoprotein
MNCIAIFHPPRRLRHSAPLLLLALTGCMTAPNVSAPAMPEPLAAQQARTTTVNHQPTLTESTAPTQWWTLFNDTTLSALEADVANNLDLRAAVTRIEASRSQLGLAEATQRPQVGVNAAYGRSAISENSPLYLIGAPSYAYNSWSLGLQASWELDLWGHLQHLEESARANLQAAWYAEEGVRVSVTAEVARSYLLLRGVQAQISLAEDDLQAANDLVHMAESRERNGVASRADAAAARVESAGVQARLLQLQHQRDTLMNALALLLGQAPRELDKRLAAAVLPAMPARLPIGLSSELARQRPDILQAQAKLSAAVADIGAAQADFYPRIGLGVAAGVGAFKLSDLDSWDSRQFSVGPTFHLPIFDGGRLKSNLALSQTHHQLAAIAYQKTVLQAWHEVDDALGAYANERARHEQLVLAQEQSQATLDVARNNYREGSGNMTSVLQAQRGLLASRKAVADSATTSALTVVGLYRALGGGWSSELKVTDRPTVTAEARP